jgi:preprotein translocase subunit SecG
MYLLCVSLIVLVSVLMCLIVLIQNSKGGGLAAGFASSNQIMGVRKTTDFLEKATWTLAAIMVVVSIAAAYSIPSKRQVEVGYSTEQMTQPVEVPATDAAPEAPAAPAEAPEQL